MANPTPEENTDYLEEILERHDAHYAEDWVNQAQRWYEIGLNDVVLQCLGAATGKPFTHVDLGCGPGALLVQLHRDFPEALLFGVDNNAQMLVNAARLHQATGTPFNLAICKCLYQKAEDRFKRIPEYHADFDSMNFKDRSKVQLVCDDIRQMDVIKRILDGQQIDSGSLLLPGTSLTLAFEYPYALDTQDRNIQGQRITEIMSEVRSKATEFMAQTLKPGGKYVCAERMAVVMDDMQRRIRDSLEKHLGPMKDYFDFGKSFTLKDETMIKTFLKDGSPQMDKALNNEVIESKDSRIGLMLPRREGELDELRNNKSTIAAIVFTLIRNNTPFKK